MERTADRSTLHFRDDIQTFTPSDSCLRPPSLILSSLDVCVPVSSQRCCSSACLAGCDEWSDARVAETKRRGDAVCHAVEAFHTRNGKFPGSSNGPAAGLPGRDSAADGWRQELAIRRDRQWNELQSPSVGIGARSNPPETGGGKMGFHEVICDPKTSNPAMEPTASRRTIQLSMSSSRPSVAMRAPARGASSCSC